MKINFKISYFYQVRFFKENQLPVSTALWDPKWYHDFKDQEYLFRDKNNVINGLRIPALSPQSSECTQCSDKNTSMCLFMKSYMLQLRSLDFNSVLDQLYLYAEFYLSHFDEVDIVLLVHETPSNPCSERGPLIKWFSENGIELSEFKKGDDNL